MEVGDYGIARGVKADGALKDRIVQAHILRGAVLERYVIKFKAWYELASHHGDARNKLF